MEAPRGLAEQLCVLPTEVRVVLHAGGLLHTEFVAGAEDGSGGGRKGELRKDKSGLSGSMMCPADSVIV